MQRHFFEIPIDRRVPVGVRKRYAVSSGLLRLACPIQFHKHEPCVSSSWKKTLDILIWIRQRLLEKRTQGECKKVESGEGVAQGRSVGNISAYLRLQLVRIASMMETGTNGVGQGFIQGLEVQPRN